MSSLRHGFVTRREAARLLGVSMSTIDRQAGMKLPRVKIGRRVLFDVRESADLANAQFDIDLENRRAGIAKGPGEVYFAEAEGCGRVKIGWSRTASRRIEDLRTASPFPLRLLVTQPGRIQDERATHQRFSHLRIPNVGQEWFFLRDDLLTYVQSLPPLNPLATAYAMQRGQTP